MKLQLPLLLILLWGINSGYCQTSNDYIYAKRLYNDSMFELAAKQFQQFVDKFPDSPRAPNALLMAGDSYFKLERYKEACEQYIYLILRYPAANNRDQAQFKIGECFREQGNYVEAAKAYQQVKVFYSKSKWADKALLEAARMYVLGNEYDSAIEIYFEFLDNYPQSPHFLKAHLELAKTFRAKGELNRALIEIEKILETTQKGIIRSQTLLLKAEIEQSLGKLANAEQTYRSIINTYGKSGQKHDVVLAQTYLSLAKTYRAKGIYAESNKYLSRLEAFTTDSTLLKEANIIMGDNYSDLEEYAKAMQQYQAVANFSDSLNSKLIFKIAKVYEKLANFQQAIDSFKSLLEKCDHIKYCEYSYLAIARNYLRLGHAPIALKYLRDFLEYFPDSNCADRVKYKIAYIHETALHEYERALRIYYDFIDAFPQSSVVDDAQLGIARCYEGLQNYDQALKEYQKFLRRYPGSEKTDEVEKRIVYLTNFFVSTETGALKKFASLIGEVINKPAQDVLTYKLALTYFKELKDYTKAIALFKKCYNSSSTAIPKDELLFYLANSFQNLAEKEFYQQGTTSVYLDSAQNNYLRLVENFPQSDWSDDAAISLIQSKLLKSDGQQTKSKIIKEFLNSFIINYPASSYLDYAYFQLGSLYLNGGIQTSSDSLSAFNQFEKVITEYPQSRYTGTSLFNQGLILLEVGDKTKAQQKFEQYVQQCPQHKKVAQAYFILAKLFTESKDYKNAYLYLEKIVTNYFYSHYADSARVRLSDIYLKTKDYSAGINHLLKLKNEIQQPCAWQNNYEPEIIYKLGLFYQQSGEKQQAIAYYQDYLKRFPSASRVADVLFRLAELFNTTIATDRDMALSYLKRLIADFPKNPYHYQANIYAGDILLKKKDYLSARKHFLEAIKWTSNSDEKVYPTMQAIICLHKAGRVAKADTETKKLKKTYHNIDDYLARIELSKGDYYFEKKFFETAEKIYKAVKSKFKKTDYGPKAEFALGKLYLTLNKDEEALKILTAMPQKYPHHNVIPEVYLTLGDFYYFKARQTENAMLAYKNAIEQSVIEESLLARGMNSLIRCYFELHLLDQALVLSRKYLERFPLAANAFDIRIQIGIIYYNLKEYDRAIDYLKTLKREADRESEPRIQYWIGDCYMEQGRFEKAITEYLKVKYLSRPSKLNWAVTAQYKAGVAYMKLNKMKEAKTIFQKIVVEQGAESPFGKGAKEKINEIERVK